jgi:hypothetical protein
MASSDQREGQSLGRRPQILFFLGLLLVMPIGIFSNAQTTTSGGLAGVVTDPSGAVVPNADVEIKDNAKGTHQSTKTDREGAYRFFFLAPERYTLSVSHDGFRTQNRALNVLLGPPVSVNVTLQIAEASSSVSVTADAPIVKAENGDVSTTMSLKQISEVPNPGNDLTYIAQTAPAAIMNTDVQGSGNFSILGMPGFSYLFTMDGMINNENGNNSSLNGAIGLVLGQNEIQEATVVSTGYSGQFGGAAGGNVNYITKSGSNDYHGNAQYYWNSSVLNANDWFNKAFGVPRPFDIANQWAGSVGGPIRKNKLFFFLDVEGLRLTLPQIFQVVVPSPQFEAATIANIDSKFGSASASDIFYKKIFTLYNAAPGASSARPGGVSPATDPSGCTGFPGLGVDPRTNMSVPCAMTFASSVNRPSSDTLGSGRVDWNLGANDRVFVRLQGNQGVGAFYVDPISPSFDDTYKVSFWQGQISETHTFGTSAANQFLLAGYSYDQVYKVQNPSQALSTFPTTLNFNASGAFTQLGGQDYIGTSGVTFTQYQISEDIVKTGDVRSLGSARPYLQSTGTSYRTK